MNTLVKILVFLNIPRVLDILQRAIATAKLRKITTVQGTQIKLIFQGGYQFDIVGDVQKFEIDQTSHIKSSCFIECSGGVKIGRYFHCGRGLTIFSTNHNFRNGRKIPYDDTVVEQPVIIEDFVWLGANVTIVPGVTVGEGSVVGAGTVVNKDVPPYSVVSGNGYRVIGTRDKDHFDQLKRSAAFLE